MLQKLRAQDHIHSKKPQNTELWVRLGRASRFDEQTERLWLGQEQNVQHSPPSHAKPWSHCGWLGCFCYEQRPLYRLAACKGCYVVYYSGKICQKRYAPIDTRVSLVDVERSDWKQGAPETMLPPVLEVSRALNRIVQMSGQAGETGPAIGVDSRVMYKQYSKSLAMG